MRASLLFVILCHWVVLTVCLLCGLVVVPSLWCSEVVVFMKSTTTEVVVRCSVTMSLTAALAVWGCAMLIVSGVWLLYIMVGGDHW